MGGDLQPGCLADWQLSIGLSAAQNDAAKEVQQSQHASICTRTINCLHAHPSADFSACTPRVF